MPLEVHEWFLFDRSKQYSPKRWEFWVVCLVTLFILMWAAVCAGLTVGLMSIDALRLQILKKTHQTNPSKLKRIHKLEPLLRNHHYLLATIVTANCFAMELLPLALDQLVPTGYAIVIAVTLLLVFGEIIPQALFIEKAVELGALFVPFIRLCSIIFFPFAYPSSLLLNRLVPSEEDDGLLLKRRELKHLLDLYVEKNEAVELAEAGASRSPSSSSSSNCSFASGLQTSRDQGVSTNDDHNYQSHLSNTAEDHHNVDDDNHRHHQSSKMRIGLMKPIGEIETHSDGRKITTPNDSGSSLLNGRKHTDDSTDLSRKESHLRELHDDEVLVMKGALSLSTTSVGRIMRPIQECVMLSGDDFLCQVIDELVQCGLSRIPVYSGKDRYDIIGFVLVKQLIAYIRPAVLSDDDGDHQQRQTDIKDLRMKDVPLIQPLTLDEDCLCGTALNRFQKGRSHLAVIVGRNSSDPAGFLTLEDLFEHIIGEPITDETDQFLG